MVLIVTRGHNFPGVVREALQFHWFRRHPALDGPYGRPRAIDCDPTRHAAQPPQGLGAEQAPANRLRGVQAARLRHLCHWHVLLLVSLHPPSAPAVLTSKQLGAFWPVQLSTELCRSS
jgi:hypothetical protein